MQTVLWIGAGGFLGANARYALGVLAARYFGTAFPYGTLVANTVGSFVLGAFLAWTSERVLADPAYRSFLAVGFCGAFTTFSSYAFESARLYEEGHLTLALANVTANNVLALAGVVGGLALARAIAP